MKAEYRITIGHKHEGAQQSRSRSRLEVVKAVLLTLLALSAVIGMFLAAFVVGSIIASLLLILIGISLVAWTIRRLFLMFRKEQTKS
jgi:heme O synthase-like polyprenyltransferase